MTAKRDNREVLSNRRSSSGDWTSANIMWGRLVGPQNQKSAGYEEMMRIARRNYWARTHVLHGKYCDGWFVVTEELGPTAHLEGYTR